MKSNLIPIILLGLSLALACEKSSEKSAANSQLQSMKPEPPHGEGNRKNKGMKEGGGPGDRPKIVAVRTQTAETQNLPESVEVVGVLTGRKQADVYSRVPGKLSYIGPGEGRAVREGEVLFRVDRSDPGESFLATPIASPISGWVGQWLVSSIGAQVTAQEPVVSVVDDEALKTSVMLPTSQWLKVSDTTPVRMRVDGKMRSAKVTGVARAAEATSSRGTVTVEISNSDHKWKAGMVALVAFDIDIKPRMVIPASALSITDQGPFVFLVKDGRALAGFTINVMTLMALSLSIELLVDDAIVVRENIFRHLQDQSIKATEAAYRGTREVSLAVVATTLTIVAVFLPVGFMSGTTGQFFKQFAVTVIFAVMISLSAIQGVNYLP